jgi:hypothetical protein
MIKKYKNFLEAVDQSGQGMVWNSSWGKDDDSKYDNSYEDDDFDTPEYNEDDYKYNRDKSDDELAVDEEMEHLLYVLRGKLKEKGLRDFTVSNRGYDVTITSKLTPKERLVDVVTIFQSIQSIQIDIFSEYLSDFDMYENMRGETILEFLFYISEEDYEDFAKENIHF